MNAESELAKMWSIFPPDVDTPIHLRALPPKGLGSSLPVQNLIFTPAEYPLIIDRCAAVSASALSLNARGYNLYTCLNPIKPNHMRNGVNDNDISCRRRLLIDIDRVSTLVAPATNDDIAHAEMLADRITAALLAATTATVGRVMSGNGVHLYLSLDDHPNDLQSTNDCKRLLKGLASEFDDDVMKIDTGVSNAGRITKVPGTIMRKGTESADRPYRMAVVA